MYKRIWLFCKNFIYSIILVTILSLTSLICFKSIICSNMAKKINNVKYDLVIDDIKYYELARVHKYIFPLELNETWNIKDFHYYSYKDEKYEIILYVSYSQEEYDNEILRLNSDAIIYNYTIRTTGDIKKYIFKCDEISELYEYAVIDDLNQCVFYAYTYGIKKEDSTIVRKYRL